MESTLALKYVLIFQLANVAIKIECGVIMCVCVLAASLYLSAGRPMTNRLLLSFQ